jgi:ATP-binding cassette subfamily F protein uup
MFLVRLDAVNLAFGARKLLRQANLSIEAGERVCLVGRNGAGKTSLLHLVSGELEPDEGEVRRQGHLCISELAQVWPADENALVGEFVSVGLAHIIALTRQYQAQAESTLDARGLRELQELHGHIDAHGGWHPQQQVETVCTEMGLDPAQPMTELSGGWRRRAALARALVARPDLLLLDEPVAGMSAREREQTAELLKSVSAGRTLILIEHDMVFVELIAQTVTVLHQGKLLAEGSMQEVQSDERVIDVYLGN